MSDLNIVNVRLIARIRTTDLITIRATAGDSLVKASGSVPEKRADLRRKMRWISGKTRRKWKDLSKMKEKWEKFTTNLGQVNDFEANTRNEKSRRTWPKSHWETGSKNGRARHMGERFGESEIFYVAPTAPNGHEKKTRFEWKWRRRENHGLANRDDSTMETKLGRIRHGCTLKRWDRAVQISYFLHERGCLARKTHEKGFRRTCYRLQ